MLAFDASAEMVQLARRRLGERAQIWCQDVLSVDLAEPVDAIVSTAALHWVTDHDRLWARLGRVLRPGGRLEVQCGGQGNIIRVREVIDAVARDIAPDLVAWSPWVFAGPQETDRRLRHAGFTAIRCWLTDRPTSRPGPRPRPAVHPRFHVHYTPTYSSWLNQMERWFTS